MDWQDENGVYFIFDPHADRITIGHGNVPARFRSHQRGNSQKLYLLAVAVGETRADEQNYHRQFQAYRIGRTEWFRVNSELKTLIQSVQERYRNVGAPPVPFGWGTRYRDRERGIDERRRR